MYKPLTLFKKQTLVLKFKRLKSFKEKVSFWDNKLGFKYIEFIQWNWALSRGNRDSEIADKIHDLQDFEINNPKEELSEYNVFILQEYKHYCEKHFDNSGLVESKHREIDFENELKNIKDKAAFINNEIRNVENEIAYKEKNAQNFYNNSLKLFLHGFKEYYFNNTEPNLAYSFKLEELIALSNGKYFAEYKRYLERELLNASKKVKFKNKNVDYSISQQFWIMHYLDVLEEIKKNGNATKSAEFLSALFNKTYKGVYEKVNNYDLRNSKISREKKKVKQDLEKILPLFEGLGNKKTISQIKSDIANIGL